MQRARPIEFPVVGLGDDEIRLRLLAESDVPALVAAVQDPEIPRWTRVPERYGPGEAETWLEAESRGRANGTMLSLAITDACSGELIGSVGLPSVEWDEDRCELGYWIARERRGRGIAPRAIRALSAWVFRELGLERIAILVDVENAPSLRAAEKAGFTYEGVLRSYIENKGRRRDTAVFSLLQGEL